MSQIQVPVSSSPTVAITYTADDATTATPADNNLNVFSADVDANNLNGIRSVASGSTVTYQLTNRITGTATTTDGITPVTIYSFSLGATPGTYTFLIRIAAFNSTDALGAGYTSFAIVRTTGAAGTVLGSSVGIADEEGAMTTVLVANQVTGNNYELVATGLAGKTINYVAVTEYVFAS